MRTGVILLVAAFTVGAQTTNDARAIVQLITTAVRSADSIRAEGISVDETTGPSPWHRETQFELVSQGPLLMRYHETYVSGQALQICDGSSRWNYSEVSNSYARYTDQGKVCAPPVARWSDLTEGLVSATVTGQDHSEFEGRSQQCELIEILYATSRRTLCVNRARHLILRERRESLSPDAAQPQTVETITYSRIQYLRAQPAEVFQFHPPAGSSQGGFDLPLTGEGGSGHYLGSLRPVVLSKTEPQYTPQALLARWTGSVMVSLVVDHRGVPRDIKVLRGLGMGLDQKAIEAVANWRFRPGAVGGQPVAMVTQVKVDFRNP